MRALWRRATPPSSASRSRQVHSAQDKQRDPLKALKYQARKAELRHAARTSLDPAAGPLANLEQSLTHFRPYINANSIALREPFNLQHHAQPWQQLLQKGWHPLVLQNNLHKLLPHRNLLFDILRLTAHELASLPLDTPEAQVAWERFEHIIRVLVPQSNRDASVSCNPAVLDSIISEWAWNGFKHNHPLQHATYVLKLWSCLLSIQKPAPESSSGQTTPDRLRLHQPLHEAIVTAASIVYPDLPSFLSDYASKTTATSLKDLFLATGHLSERCRHVTTSNALDDASRQRLLHWLAQTDLRLLWERGGAEGFRQRVRRWADRKDALLVQRHLDALLNACSPQSAADAWLQLNWNDEADAAYANMSDDDMQTSEADPSETFDNRPSASCSLQATPTLFSSFIVSLMRMDQFESVSQLWQTIDSWNLPPTSTFLKALLAGHMHRQDPDAVRAVIQQIQSQGYAITADMHLDEARTILRAGDKDKGMAKIGWIFQHCQPLDENHYKRLFHVLIKSGMFNQASNLLSDVPSKQITAAILNPFISFHCRKERADTGFDESIQLLKRFNVQPDAVSSAILLNGALFAGRHDHASQLLQNMSDNQSLEGTRAYASVLSHLANSRSAPLLRHALSLLRMLERKHPSVLSEIVYSDLVQALCSQSDFTDPTGNSATSTRGVPYHIQEARKLIDRMQARGVPVSGHVYNALISAYISLGSRPAAQEAMRVLGEMRSAHIAKTGHDFVHPRTWSALLFGLSRARHWDLAQQAVAEMDKMGFVPRSESLAKVVQQVRTG